MASLHRKLYACFWARAYWLQRQDREGTQKGRDLSSALCQKYQATEMSKGHVRATSCCSSLGFGWSLGSSKSPMLLLPFKKANCVWDEKGRVKGESSRRWVSFILLMNYFPRQACLRESWVTEEKPSSHHSLTWVTFLNNIILV